MTGDEGTEGVGWRVVLPWSVMSVLNVYKSVRVDTLEKIRAVSFGGSYLGSR